MSIGGRYWLPGPVDVDSAVAERMSTPVMGHRRPEGVALAGAIQSGLKTLFGTHRDVLFSTGSGTSMMECAVRCGVEERILAVVSGYFGERFASIAEACGKEVVRLHVPRGEALTAEQLERVLDGPPIDAVSMVHVETSTGAAAPIPELIRVMREAWDPVILVDSIASFGGMPVDPVGWDADFVLAASQKALAVPPGLAFGVASPRFLSRARKVEGRGTYLDAIGLHRAAKAGQFPQTPSMPIVHALLAQLDRVNAEGLDARFERHREMRETLERWVDGRDDVAILAPTGKRADTVTALVFADRSARRISSRLDEAGWQVGAGLGDDSDRELRIGHMGEGTVEQLQTLLETLEGVL